MLESPLIDELVLEKYGDQLTEKLRETARETARVTARETARETARTTAQRGIRTVLETRFGDVPRDVVEEIASVDGDEQLQALLRTAAACPDLDAFRCAAGRS